ncbi:AN1-type zinc finger domain-containing protein [Halogranum rubrum]|uniref:AN1-type domain-containing protein n=1 Tax=Halogranum salarium B-1 TaxID=1210908 RepID=J3JH64_9EURY|nr:hypothetical protein HSB1_13220 [Halogranum salarium B-1]
MVLCERCDTELLGPRPCAYCGRQYCAVHRFPERHDCSGLDGREDGTEWFDDSVSVSE